MSSYYYKWRIILFVQLVSEKKAMVFTPRLVPRQQQGSFVALHI